MQWWLSCDAIVQGSHALLKVSRMTQNHCRHDIAWHCKNSSGFLCIDQVEHGYQVRSRARKEKETDVSELLNSNSSPQTLQLGLDCHGGPKEFGNPHMSPVLLPHFLQLFCNMKSCLGRRCFAQMHVNFRSFSFDVICEFTFLQFPFTK